MVIYMMYAESYMTLTTSTEANLLRSPLEEVIEVVPPQGKTFFYQSQLSLLTLEVPQYQRVSD